MAQTSKPLEEAIRKILWPYLKEVGFTKVSGRKFAREKNDVFQQLWVDANGVSKSRSTRIVLCSTFPFASPNGYMDPHGFIICGSKDWNMSKTEPANEGMHQVIAALASSELRALDEISNIETMLGSIKSLSQTPLQKTWHPTHLDLWERWRNGDVEVLSIVSENRQALKL